MFTRLKETCRRMVESGWFRYGIMAVIFLNSLLIGVETAWTSPLIRLLQELALYVFTLEILVRWTGRQSAKAYFSDGWNIFDILIVTVSYIPDSILPAGNTLTLFRILRVFRVLRLVKAFPELRLMIAVLVKSFRTLGFNALLFLIFSYLYAVAGVTLFRLPDPATAAPEMQARLVRLAETAPPAPAVSPDPYGDIGEAFFTLFRALTGEDWTDLRYNLVEAVRLGVLDVDETVITAYHVSWFIIAAFLLLNLVVGAIINNYQVVIEKERQGKICAMQKTEEELTDSVHSLEHRVEKLIALLEKEQRAR